MITFDKLLSTLDKKHKTIYQLVRDKVIGGGTLNRIRSNESISTDTINAICNYLHCRPSDIMTYIPDWKEEDK